MMNPIPEPRSQAATEVLALDDDIRHVPPVRVERLLDLAQQRRELPGHRGYVAIRWTRSGRSESETAPSSGAPAPGSG
jgi:hypothetical protein